MSTATAENVFEQSVRGLPPQERLRLAALILDELTLKNPLATDESDAWSQSDMEDAMTFSLHHADSSCPVDDEAY